MDTRAVSVCRSDLSCPHTDRIAIASTARPVLPSTRSVDSASAEELTSESGPDTTPESAPESAPETTPKTTPDSTPAPTSVRPKETVLARAIRINMRAIPHPVALISCNAPTGPAGMLVSSFNTITLNPDPYISFNVKLPSRTYSALSSHGTFNVHALNITGIWLGHAFLQWKVKKGDKWPGLGKKETLVDHVGVKFTLMCEWVREKSVEVGDHVVVVGRVRNVVAGRGAREWGAGMIYSEGQFRRPGKPVDTRANRPKSGKKVWEK